MAANNIYIQVDFNSQSAQQNVNALNTAIGQTGPVAQKSSTQATAALNSVNVSVSQTTKAFEELTQALAGLGIARIAQNVIQIGSELNRAQQAMAAFTGSATDAVEVLEKVSAIAQQSPFQFKDLAETARRLAGFGVAAKDIPPMLKAITDQVAAFGGSIENVNGMVTIFGRMMNKEMVGAMDIMRMLPAQGVKVMDALTKALSKQPGMAAATFEDVKKAMKEGALDPMNTWLVMLGAMQQQTAGAGARMKDFAMILKNIGDAFDRLKESFMSEKGFGPALRTLGEEIQAALVPIAALIKFLMDLPEPMKVLIVNLVAGAAAVIAFGGAWKLFSTIASPAITVLTGLATAFKELGVAILVDNPAILAAIGLIGVAMYGLSKAFPVQAQKVLDWMSGIWDKIKATAKNIAQQTGILPPEVAAGAAPTPAGPIAKETQENLETVQKQVQEWADSAGKTLLQALSSPVDAVVIKYKDLFNKLDDEIKSKFISVEHAEELRDQLTTAQKMEMEAKVFEKKKQDIAELYKTEGDRAKAAYDAQILYIEAQDEQDLRKKVANYDRITQLRIESANTETRLQNEQLQDVYNAQVEYLEKYKDLYKAAGITVSDTEQQLRQEMETKQKANEAKAVDDAQKYRLEGWKKTNDAIIEDQKRVFESFKGVFDQIFDAITGKNPGKAMADVFKKLVIDQARDLFSSSAAGLATAVAGYGYPEGGITRGSGILSQLLQHGMPPRPMMAPPEGYNPAKADSVFKPIEESANRLDLSASLYNDATVRFALAVGQFTAGAGAQGDGQGYAERMATPDVSSAITRASLATGVSESLLRTVAQNESAFNPFAVSGKGAAGLFQLMPATQQDWGVTNPFDPGQSAMAGAQQLKRLLAHYGGNVPLALAAYNWGPGNVDKALASGAAFPAETQAYVRRITNMLPSAQGGADGGADFTPPPSGGVALPAAGEVAAPIAGLPTVPYSPLPMGWGIPQLSQSDIDKYSVSAGATPATVAHAKQAGILGTLAGLAGPGGVKTAGLGGLDFSKLKELFGIGAATTIWGPNTGTTLQSVLTSKGMGALASAGGMMLFSQGLQKRSPLLTTLGGGFAGVGAIMTNPKLMAQLAAGPGGLAAGLGAGAAAGVGLGLYASGLQRGGFGGLAMDVGGGALAGAGIGFIAGGGPMGAAIGAAIGAGVGLISGVVRLFVHTEQEKIRAQIKQVYGIDISNRQILGQIQQIVDQNYGGNVAVGVRSQEVQNLVRLYALSTGQAANMPRPMYAATIAQSTGGLQLQPVYQGGVQVQNPYTGVTTYQYQTAVAAAQGLMPNPGSGLGVPGGSGLVNWQFGQLNQQTVLSTIQNNPAAITMAAASGATAGDSRLSTTQAMQEPLTLLT